MKIAKREAEKQETFFERRNFVFLRYFASLFRGSFFYNFCLLSHNLMQFKRSNNGNIMITGCFASPPRPAGCLTTTRKTPPVFRRIILKTSFYAGQNRTQPYFLMLRTGGAPHRNVLWLLGCPVRSSASTSARRVRIFTSGE